MKKKKKKRSSKNHNKQNLNRKRMHKKVKHSTSRKIDHKAESNNFKESLEKDKIYVPNNEIKKETENLENTDKIKEENHRVEQEKNEKKLEIAVLLKKRKKKKEKKKQT